MKTRCRIARTAVVGLLAGLGLLGGAAAQEPERVPLTKLPAVPFTGTQQPTLAPLAPAPCDAKPDDAGDRFAKLPPVAVFPRLGYFPIFPTGPGYYTFLDVLQGNYRDNAPKHPHPRLGLFPWSFFDADFRYLDDPNNTETDYWDWIKRRRFCDDTCMISSGGEIRARYNHEVNSRLQNEGPFAGRNNTYDLYRARVYADLYLTERFRLFAEFITAISPNFLLPPLPSDRDHADFLNLFVDAQIGTLCDQPVWARVGRQELLYGSERLVSPLDWVNARRTFQGAKAFWHSPKDDIDLFWVQPVLPDSDKFNSVDNNVNFAGVWYTHRDKPGHFLDAYYLMLDEANQKFEGTAGQKGGRTVHTFGTRWVGQKDNWLWDVEGMLQCGEHVNQGLFAKAFTLGGGYYFKDCPTTPIVWAYYDYASGTPNPGEGTLNQTFSQLFPFGHYYFGFIDIVGRRNINDLSAYLTLYPDKWIVTQLQMHNFWLDSARDALYAANGLPVRRDKTGAAGNYVGTEFDMLVNFHLSFHSDLLLSYSYMFAGRFIRETARTEGGKEDPQALYAQYTYRW